MTIQKKVGNTKNQKARASVSAESYGMFNKKASYVPKVVPKSEDTKKRIRERLDNAFMFANLDEKEKNIVIGAMEECSFQANDYVIKQGENGNILFCVDSGALKCQRRMKPTDAEDTYLKTYIPGESFGELALLYNAPRAATIIAEQDSVCFSLDRDCFNNIVKESAIKRRERYDSFVRKIEILQSLDHYERGKLADCLTTENFKKGEYVIRQGEMGNKLYFIEEGTMVATKKAEDSQMNDPGVEDGQMKVFDYTENMYFGELALLNETPRQASIKVIFLYQIF